MNIRTATLALALAAGLSATSAEALGPPTQGTHGLMAGRIVGLWRADGAVRPCANPAAPVMNVRNNLLFHAGGTLTENPGGLPSVTGNSRSMGLGTWGYDAAKGRHTLHLRFDNYANGVYVGYQTVDREITLGTVDQSLTGPVLVTRYDTAGNVQLQLCGTAVQTRL
jgi:hypothetical protein